MERAMSREEIRHIPFGVGICGHVAQSKKTVTVDDAYKVRSTTYKVSRQSLLVYTFLLLGPSFQPFGGWPHRLSHALSGLHARLQLRWRGHRRRADPQQEAEHRRRPVHRLHRGGLESEPKDHSAREKEGRGSRICRSVTART